MENINDIEAFVRVAELESFSGAARDLHMPKSTLSRRISRMEERLGVQLFVRSTRQISLTEMGEIYLERCQRIVADIKDAEDSIKSSMNMPTGTIRVTAPNFSGNAFMCELVTTFMETYPDIKLELNLTNKFVNLIEQNYDVAIRGGTLDDSSLVARRLTPVDLVVVGSPTYLNQKGRPKSPEDLLEHQCLLLDSPPSDRRWKTKAGDYIMVQGTLLVNDLEVLRSAAAAHHGLIRVPRSLVMKDIEQGILEVVLNDEMTLAHGIYILYPPNRFISAKVRVFIDFAVKFFQQHADEFHS